MKKIVLPLLLVPCAVVIAFLLRRDGALRLQKDLISQELVQTQRALSNALQIRLSADQTHMQEVETLKKRSEEVHRLRAESVEWRRVRIENLDWARRFAELSNSVEKTQKTQPTQEHPEQSVAVVESQPPDFTGSSIDNRGLRSTPRSSNNQPDPNAVGENLEKDRLIVERHESLPSDHAQLNLNCFQCHNDGRSGRDQIDPQAYDLGARW